MRAKTYSQQVTINCLALAISELKANRKGGLNYLDQAIRWLKKEVIHENDG